VSLHHSSAHRRNGHRANGIEGKFDTERGALADFAYHPDLAAVELDDMARDCEPQPSASGIARLATIYAIVPIEDGRKLITRNATPGIDYMHCDAPLLQRHNLDADDAARGRMAHGILDQILQYAFDHTDVRVQLHVLTGELA